MTKKRLFCILAAVLFGISAVWAIIDTPILYGITYPNLHGFDPWKNGVLWHDWVFMLTFLAFTALFIVKAIKDQLPDWAFIIPLSAVIVLRFYSLFASIDNYVQMIEMLKKYVSSSFTSREMMHYYVDIFLNVTMSVIGIAAVVFLLLSLILKKKLHKVFFIPAALPVFCLFVQTFGYGLDLAISGAVMWKDIVTVISLLCFSSFSFGLQSASYFFFGFALVKEEKVAVELDESPVWKERIDENVEKSELDKAYEEAIASLHNQEE